MKSEVFASVSVPVRLSDDSQDRIQRRRLFIGLALSVALHAALLIRINGSPGAAPSPIPGSQLIEARLISSIPSPQMEARISPAPKPAVAPVIVETPSPPRPLKQETTPVPRASEPAPAPVAPRLPFQQTLATQVEPQPTPAAAPPVATASTVNASDYRVAGTLNAPPRVLEERDAPYPRSAGNTEGSVVVLVLLSSNGLIDDAVIARSSPPGVFDESALAAVRGSRFSPGILAGAAVKSQLMLELKYTVRNRVAWMNIVQAP